MEHGQQTLGRHFFAQVLRFIMLIDCIYNLVVSCHTYVCAC
uniref:Uncharacterized protein n=1 Tax=Rhizophora mucronata TaxID=61149 RepID=A0A2P2N3M7_RHIMU